MKEIGNSLREIRIGKGISLEEVEAATKIRSYYIEAIENGDLEAMPGQIYTIGFVRSYAKFLGLQDDEIVNAYKKYYAQQADGTADQKMEQVIVEQNHGQIRKVNKRKTEQEKTLAKRPVRNNATPPRPIRTREKSFGGKFIWVALLLVIIFALLILYFIGSRNQQETPPVIPPTNQEEQNPSQVEPPVTPDETDTGQLPDDGTGTLPEDTTPGDDTTPTEPETPVSGVEVKVTTTAACWVSVSIDGKEQQETIPANESRTYTGEEKIVVKYGNAGYVSVEHNGKPDAPFTDGSHVITREYGKTDSNGATE